MWSLSFWPRFATKIKEETFIPTSQRSRDGQLGWRLEARQWLVQQAIPHLHADNPEGTTGERDRILETGFRGGGKDLEISLFFDPYCPQVSYTFAAVHNPFPWHKRSMNSWLYYDGFVEALRAPSFQTGTFSINKTFLTPNSDFLNIGLFLNFWLHETWFGNKSARWFPYLI